MLRPWPVGELLLAIDEETETNAHDERLSTEKTTKFVSKRCVCGVAVSFVVETRTARCAAALFLACKLSTQYSGSHLMLSSSSLQ